jgi:hypothetical protein
MPYEIQAVLFDKYKYTAYQARTWLLDNDIKPIKRVHKTQNWLRYRIREPSYNEYSTKMIGDHIMFILGK